MPIYKKGLKYTVTAKCPLCTKEHSLTEPYPMAEGIRKYCKTCKQRVQGLSSSVIMNLGRKGRSQLKEENNS